MALKLKNVDFEKICRTCLATNRQLKTISKQVVEMIMEYASVNVTEDEALPNNICNRCVTQLKKFNAFRRKLDKCQLKLKKLLRNKSKDEQSKQNLVTIDANLQMKFQNSDFEDARVVNDIQLLSDPPPLVPLVPKLTPEEIPAFPPNDENPLDVALKPLTDETPPLIPIKKYTSKPTNIEETLYALSAAMAHSDVVAPIFMCPTCSEEFTEPLKFKQHIKTCHQTSSSRLICNICKKVFGDRNRLIGHLKGHTVQKLYACKVCGKRYPNPSTFKVHMRTHTGERPFKCQVCGKGFIRWAGVVGHMKSHNELKPYQCGICQRGFKMQSNLERHKVLHTGAMPFCCSYCGKTFTQNDNLQLHVRTYHTNERPYLCNECGKSFVSATRLKRHMWVHTGYKRYLCEHCNKSYSNSNDLKIHTVRTHGGGTGVDEQDKPYACNLCEMRFFHSCRLQRHLKTHTKPFECIECVRSFSREDMLNKHMLKKHRNFETQDSCPEQQYILADEDLKITISEHQIIYEPANVL